MERVLHQFPISHYCEKARWVLDYKELRYRVHNQVPGLHASPNRKLTGAATVPVLVEPGQAISGSHAIAMHLEATGQGRRLIPRSAAARLVLQDLVGFCDDVVGPAVRRFVYSLITPDPALFARVFFRGYSTMQRALGTVIAAPISKAIADMYELDAHCSRELPDVLRSAADRVERELVAGPLFLFEDSLSLADITIASLFGPLIGAAGSPWAFELAYPEFEALRAELRARPIGSYIMDLYSLRHARSAST
jgi:glutathione S-transferase